MLAHARAGTRARTSTRTSTEFRPCYRAAPGARPVFDGGEPLTGWKVGRRNGRTEWTLDLPDVALGKRYFRSLYNGGLRLGAQPPEPPAGGRPPHTR